MLQKGLFIVQEFCGTHKLCFHAADRQSLQKDCSSLVNFETTREELLEESSKQVDSTTPDTTPVKRSRKVPKSKPPPIIDLSDTESEDSDIDNGKKLKVQKSTTRKPIKGKRSAAIHSAQERARQIFSQHAEDKRTQDEVLKRELQEQREMIKKLQEQLQAKTRKFTTCLSIYSATVLYVIHIISLVQPHDHLRLSTISPIQMLCR